MRSVHTTPTVTNATARSTQVIATRKTHALQLGDVIWRERNGFQHGKRPFIVITILNDNEALAVPTSTTVDFMGRMPAVNAGGKAAWVAPNGITRVKRDRYTVARKVGQATLEQCWKAFDIWFKFDPKACNKAINQAKTAGK